MLFYIALTLMFLYPLVLVPAQILLPLKLKPKQILWLWYIFMAAFAVVAFYAEPTDAGPDLNRHYESIYYFRSGAYHVFLGNTMYGPMYVFRLILYFVSLTDYDGLLPAGTVLLFGILTGQIAYHYLSKPGRKYSTDAILLFYFAALGGVSPFYLVTGIRNAISCAIWAYGYFLYYENHKKIRYYILAAIACMIHTAALIMVVILIVYQFISGQQKEIRLILTAVLAFGLPIIMATPLMPNLLESTGIAYISRHGHKWRAYTGYEFYQIEFFSLLILLIFYFFCVLYAYQKAGRERGLFAFVVLITVAGSGFQIFFQRLPYAIGLLSLPILNDILIKAGKNRAIFNLIAVVVLGGRLLFGFHALYSHLTFHGIYFRDFLQIFTLS